MNIAHVISRLSGFALSPAYIAARENESAGAFAARLHAAANIRGLEVRGWFGDRQFIARPGDTLQRVLEPFYQSARW